MRIVIVGAGAAGCFCAIELKRRLPGTEVIVLEAGSKPLAKVAITGGGRCNLTNTFDDIRSLKEAYPRGEKLVKRAFCLLDNRVTMDWFEREGVRLTVQEDQCVFPVSQDAMQIVHTLTHLMARLGVDLRTSSRVMEIVPPGPDNSHYQIKGAGFQLAADSVVVTTGGSPRREGLSFLDPLNLEIVEPVPSLFSFNIEGMSPYMGTVVQNVTTGLVGTKLRAQGPLLVTHWGMSGPAILKLSSHGARLMADQGYHVQLMVNWMGERNEEEVREQIAILQQANGAKLVANAHPEEIPSRLWTHLLNNAGVRAEQRWAEVGRKLLNRLASVLTNDIYDVKGQSRHKEEFVTCGGVALSNINLSTLESRQHPGLYLAGEVLDVDAVTGGFNLQAAWSMGFVIAVSLAEKQKI